VFLQSTALIIILELLRFEYYITGYALLHCSNLVDSTLSFRPFRGADAGQQKLVTVRFILRITDSLTVSEQWKIVTLCLSPSCQPALWYCLRADCPVTSHRGRAPRWCDASILRPCRLMTKNKEKKKKKKRGGLDRDGATPKIYDRPSPLCPAIQNQGSRY